MKIFGLPVWLWICIIVVFAILYIAINVIAMKKRNNDFYSFQEGLKIGDRVITSAGIHGTIVQLDLSCINLEIAKNTIIKVERFAVNRYEKEEKKD